jgi:hypothetical protein
VLDLAYADLHPAARGLGIRRGTLFDLLHGRLGVRQRRGHGGRDRRRRARTSSTGRSTPRPVRSGRRRRWRTLDLALASHAAARAALSVGLHLDERLRSGFASAGLLRRASRHRDHDGLAAGR